MSEEVGRELGVVMTGDLGKASSLCGNVPANVREVFRSANADVVTLQIAKGGSPTAEVTHQAIPDFLSWVAMPIFSDRAASLAIGLGCAAGEFWPCLFPINPNEKYFFHLPFLSFDIVDFGRSQFLVHLRVDPPLPMFAREIVTKPISDVIPPCFRASIPGSSQVLGELFVRDDFKSKWVQKGFAGATFREI